MIVASSSTIVRLKVYWSARLQLATLVGLELCSVYSKGRSQLCLTEAAVHDE